jgi:hypothetical protein
MTEKRYDKFSEIIEEIRNHKCPFTHELFSGSQTTIETMLASNHPERQEIGFFCTHCDTGFYIHISKITKEDKVFIRTASDQAKLPKKIRLGKC